MEVGCEETKPTKKKRGPVKKKVAPSRVRKKKKKDYISEEGEEAGEGLPGPGALL